jgi:dCMP deaminase
MSENHHYDAEAAMLAAQRQEKWDRRYLELAKHVSTWSKDPSTKVGCVLVVDNRVVSVGYNGFPEHVQDYDTRLNDRETKYAMVVHAEMNCIIQAGNKARNGVLYVYPSFMIPCICADCCKNAIQAGIVRVVGYLPDETNPRVARWKDSISHAKTMCDEAHISYIGYPENG